MVSAAFVALAALLAIGTLAWVLHPLWRARPVPVAAATAGLAVAVALLYRLVGTPTALDPKQREMPATLAEGIARLEAELRRDPRQVDGLRLLGRAYLQQERVGEARDAFARAAELAPDDADVLAEAAEVRALAATDRRFDDRAIALLERALELQPTHQRARWFLGIAQRQRGQDAQAVATWEPLLAAVDAKTADALRPQIAQARAAAGLPPPPGAAAATGAATGAGGHAIEVRLQVDPALAARASGATVFVIARRPGGPPMPVAVERHALAGLPASIVLDDADGPMPTQKLSGLDTVEVVARLSASGDAMRRDGDIESEAVRVALPAGAPVTLRLGPGAP